jgi:hypothetical protein
MEAAMKPIALMMTASLILPVAAFAQSATPGIDKRQANQERRIQDKGWPAAN